MSSRCFSVLVAVLMSAPLWAEAPAASPAARPTASEKAAAKKEVKCDPHGVSGALCTRCNAKLAPVFKAKGDWCPEHDRPESQCVLCNPDLGKKGVK